MASSETGELKAYLTPYGYKAQDSGSAACNRLQSVEINDKHIEVIMR